MSAPDAQSLENKGESTRQRPFRDGTSIGRGRVMARRSRPWCQRRAPSPDPGWPPGGQLQGPAALNTSGGTRNSPDENRLRRSARARSSLRSEAARRAHQGRPAPTQHPRPRHRRYSRHRPRDRLGWWPRQPTLSTSRRCGRACQRGYGTDVFGPAWRCDTARVEELDRGPGHRPGVVHLPVLPVLRGPVHWTMTLPCSAIR